MIEVVALIYDNPFVLYTIIHFLYFTNNRWRLPYDINLWRYLLPSVEKSSMRDHYSFGCWMAADSIVRLAPRVTK